MSMAWDGRLGFLGFIFGVWVGIIICLVIAIKNPTNTGHWECTDWQIVNFKPECHVMTKQGDR